MRIHVRYAHNTALPCAMTPAHPHLAVQLVGARIQRLHVEFGGQDVGELRTVPVGAACQPLFVVIEVGTGEQVAKHQLRHVHACGWEAHVSRAGGVRWELWCLGHCAHLPSPLCFRTGMPDPSLYTEITGGVDAVP